jgi:hypothetical protein
MAASFAGTQALRRTVRYRLVRFEQMCDDPLGTAKQIFAWLGFSITSEAKQWIEASTQADQQVVVHCMKSPMKPYSLVLTC